MHRYFVIPMVGFFAVVLAFVIYLQVINEDWKYLVPKPELPDSCNDNEVLQLVTHEDDKIGGRSFRDKKDLAELNKTSASESSFRAANTLFPISSTSF